MPENEKLYSIEENSTRMIIRRIAVFILVIAALIIVAFFVFTRFRNLSNARLALREAKNIKMSLETIDLEYYAYGTSIYDENSSGNIKKGAIDFALRLQGNIKGEMRLTGYDSKKRQITGFEYELEDYIVRFSRKTSSEGTADDSQNNDGESTTDGIWQVYHIDEILSY